MIPSSVKVLFLAANPFAANRLRLDREARYIAEAVRRATGSDAIEFITEWAVREEDLQDALLRHHPAVVHFAGHGSDGRILLEDERGRPAPVSREALLELFGIFAKEIRLVVLNACDSLPTAEGLRGIIDYSVGMRGRVRDRVAIAFARAFYGALAFGSSVDQAVALGVNRLRTKRFLEADRPTLVVRDGVVPRPIVNPRASRPDRAFGRINIYDSTVGAGEVTQGDGAFFVGQIIDRRGE